MKKINWFPISFSMFVLALFVSVAVVKAEPAEKKLDSQPYLQSVRTFADTVLKHGRDQYGKVHTPLFVDGLHSETLEPAIWMWTGEERWVLSNFANQQALLRLLDGLTELTGEARYRQSAEEATAFMLQKGVSPNGMLYWGGHSSWDLLLDKAVGTRSGKEKRGQPRLIHELKANQPYYEMLWRVNPKVAEKVMSMVWNAHVLDWPKLDFNRHGKTWISLTPTWDHEFDDSIQVPYPTSGGHYSFVGVIPPFVRSAVMLACLEENEEALQWARRMVHQWKRSCNPQTGLGGGQLSWHEKDDRLFEAMGHIHPQINETNMVATYHALGRYHRLPLAQMQAAEMLKKKLSGAEAAKISKEFITWASEDLKAYARECYDADRQVFVPKLTDGTVLDPTDIKENYYTREDLLLQLPSEELFWGYAMAYRLTKDSELWQTLRSLGTYFGLGELGAAEGPGRKLSIEETPSRSYEMIYALLELNKATKDQSFLQLASKVGDNLIALQTSVGLFPRPAPPVRPDHIGIGHSAVPGVKQPARVYARTGDEVPLALLHLAAAIDGQDEEMPQAVCDDQYFHCPYKGPLEPYQIKRSDNRTYDWLIFYGGGTN